MKTAIKKLISYMFWSCAAIVDKKEEETFSESFQPSSDFRPTLGEKATLIQKFVERIPKFLRVIGLDHEDSIRLSGLFASDYTFKVLETEDTAYLPVLYNRDGDEAQPYQTVYLALNRDGNVRMVQENMSHKVACQFYRMTDRPLVPLFIRCSIVSASGRGHAHTFSDLDLKKGTELVFPGMVSQEQLDALAAG